MARIPSFFLQSEYNCRRHLKDPGADAVIYIGGSNGFIFSSGAILNGTTLDGTQPGNPVNIEGNIVSTKEAAIGLMGTINNTGVVTLVGGDFPWLVCEGNVTLEGGGDIVMTNSEPFFFSLLRARHLRRRYDERR